jgi:hypothetical protein
MSRSLGGDRPGLFREGGESPTIGRPIGDSRKTVILVLALCAEMMALNLTKEAVQSDPQCAGSMDRDAERVQPAPPRAFA